MSTASPESTRQVVSQALGRTEVPENMADAEVSCDPCQLIKRRAVARAARAADAQTPAAASQPTAARPRPMHKDDPHINLFLVSERRAPEANHCVRILSASARGGGALPPRCAAGR